MRPRGGATGRRRRSEVSDRVATATLPLEREREGDSTMTTSCFLSELERARNEVRELQEERSQVSSPEELLHNVPHVPQRYTVYFYSTTPQRYTMYFYCTTPQRYMVYFYCTTPQRYT
ncbi:hypothetical protein EYF80_067481 [Liparis tanakae]|uniref:Uncharacterized protein n=1 Tax=Liparis tanakae TaxID=230148 RepID=A0A4Z2E0V7_9TELE|nr:hypothetical protein EYF80_067481 [Liparis tanakae]